MIDILVRFFPIFILLLIGFILRKNGILNDGVVEGLKKIIVNAALPAVLFISFISMEIEGRYLLLFGATFVCCLLLYGIGALLQKIGLCTYPLSPFFFTGFEFGMVGVALFTSLFGSENLFYILLIGLGHEFFIWFFYAPLLESKNKGSINIKEIIISFFKSPIILAILSALALNLSGIYRTVGENIFIGGIVASITALSRIVSPLILMTIGARLQLKDVQWKAGMKLIVFRFISVLIAGSLLFVFTRTFVMEIDRIMFYAFIVFFLLPPPFIIPVFLGEKYKEESVFYNNLLLLSTVVTLILLMAIMFIVGF